MTNHNTILDDILQLEFSTLEAARLLGFLDTLKLQAPHLELTRMNIVRKLEQAVDAYEKLRSS